MTKFANLPPIDVSAWSTYSGNGLSDPLFTVGSVSMAIPNGASTGYSGVYCGGTTYDASQTGDLLFDHAVTVTPSVDTTGLAIVDGAGTFSDTLRFQFYYVAQNDASQGRLTGSGLDVYTTVGTGTFSRVRGTKTATGVLCEVYCADGQWHGTGPQTCSADLTTCRARVELAPSGRTAQQAATMTFTPALTPSVTAATVSTGTPTPTTIPVIYGAGAGGTSPYTYDLAYGIGASPASWTPVASGVALAALPAALTGLTPSTLYTIRLVTHDAASATATATTTATTADPPVVTTVLPPLPGVGAQLVFTALHTDGTPASGIALTVSASDPSAVLNPTSGTTASDGTFGVTLTPGPTPGLLTVTATGTIDSTPVTLTVAFSVLGSAGRDKRRLVAAGKA